jgi:hypothetical protein
LLDQRLSMIPQHH